MSYTYRDVVKQSMQELGLLHSGEDPTGTESVEVFKKLNQMLNSFNLVGVDLEFETEASISANVPYPDDHELPFARILASQIAHLFGASISPELADNIRRDYRMIRNRYLKIEPLDVDVAINPIHNPNGYINL